MLGSYGIDTLHCRQNTQLFTTGTHHQVFLLHITLRIEYKTCNLEVREAQHFCLTQYICRNIFHLIILRKFQLIVNNVLQFAKEPGIDLRQVEDTVYCIAIFQSFSNSEHTQVRRT